jgi:ribosomal protein L37E
MPKPLGGELKPPRRGLTKMQLVCRACGWKWYPDPKKWRNHSNMLSERVLKCPSCGVPNRIRKEDVKKIWKHNLR